MTPSINVRINVTHGHPNSGDPRFCDVDCHPVLIPLPLEPFRSVTFTVALGECTCANDPDDTVIASPPTQHLSSCPARPVRVSCSISGAMWEQSEVSDWEPAETMEYLPVRADWHDVAERTGRERWALVKALVLGKYTLPCMASTPNDLTVQRDAVFAALADMAQAERAHYDAMRSVLGAGLPERIQVKIGKMTPPSTSHEVLAAYVEHLVEQVGAP